MHIIKRFGDVWDTAEPLPEYNVRVPGGVARVEGSQIQVAGGRFYDWRGDEEALPPEEETVFQGTWIAASASAMATKAGKLNALRGKVSRLWRDDGTTQHWRRARCLEVATELQASQPLYYLDYELRFELTPGPWYSPGERAVSAVLDTAEKTLVCPHLGNARVTNPRIEVWAGAEAITQVTIDVYGVAQLLWSGTLGVGQTLAIDCGARSVKIGATDAYSGFSLSSVWHRISDWLRIEPGGTSVVVTRVGGGSNAAAIIRYSDGWM